MKHVDDFIDDPTFDPYARVVLDLYRTKATLLLDLELGVLRRNKLYVTYKNCRYRLNFASTLGDVGIAHVDSEGLTYDKRVNIGELSEFSNTKLYKDKL